MSNIKIDNFLTLSFNYKITDNKYDLFCIALYVMKNGYRKFEKYTRGVKNFNMIYKKFFPNFKLRLYYDDSVLQNKEGKELIDYLEKDNQQLVKFNFHNYRDGIYHKGYIGIFSRFIQYFDYTGNDANISFVIDADWLVHNNNINKYIFKRKKNHFIKFIKSKALFLREYVVCYNPSYGKHRQTDLILGFLNGSKIKFPLKLIISFINNIPNISEKYPEMYQKAMTNYRKSNNLIFYGIDEMFLAFDLFDYIKSNKIIYMTTISNSFISFKKLLKNILIDIINSKDPITHLIINSILKLINKRFNKNLKNINSFIDLYKKEDYYRKTDIGRIYEYFHKIIITIYPKYNKYIPIKSNCFFRLDKYYDYSNNVIISNK